MGAVYVSSPPPPDDEFATRSKKRPAATGTRGDCRARLDAAHHRRVGPVLDGAIEYRCPPPPSAAGTTPRRCMRKGGGEFTVVVFAPPPPAGTRHLPPSRGRPSQCMRKGGEEFPVVVFAPRGGRERNARTAVPLDTACRAHRREDGAPCILPRTRCPGTSTPVRVDHIGRGKNNIPSTVVRRARRGIFPPPPPPLRPIEGVHEKEGAKTMVSSSGRVPIAVPPIVLSPNSNRAR